MMEDVDLLLLLLVGLGRTLVWRQPGMISVEMGSSEGIVQE